MQEALLWNSRGVIVIIYNGRGAFVGRWGTVVIQWTPHVHTALLAPLFKIFFFEFTVLYQVREPYVEADKIDWE
jgi:hypothetical protein